MIAAPERPKPLRTRSLMRPYALLYFYRRRLRLHGVQELLAGVGIAIAVALLLAALIAEGSIAGSTARVVRAVVGPAQLQLRANGPTGFDERLLARVEALPGVKQAAPLLERTATIVGPNGRRTKLDLAGTVLSLAVLDGLARTLPIGALAPGGIGLSRASAQALGISAAGAPGTRVTLMLRGRAQRLNVSAVLGPEAAGALAQALVGVMPLARMQQLAGLQGRITRIIVQSQPGRESAVRAELAALAAGTLTLAPADQDVALLRQALHPSDQASAFFAAISAVLGLLFAFTAMLLTVPERRRAIAELRLVGTRRRAIAQMVLFQALILGACASAVGVLAGYLLARGALHQSTGYLTEAFTLGNATVVGTTAPLLAFAGGVLATCLASAVPLLDLRAGRRLDALDSEDGIPGNALAGHTQVWLALAAAALIALRILVVALWPSVALAASALVALATVLAVPLVLSLVLRGAVLVARRVQRLTVLPVALASLHGATLRSLVLAATGAVAIFGSIGLGGAREDLLRGVAGFASNYAADAPVWVINPDDNQAAHDFLADEAAARIARVAGVAKVQAFQGQFLELAGRRVWMIARPPGGARRVLDSQIVQGSARAAERGLAQGGQIAVSKQLAEALHTRLGGALTLPTPGGPSSFKIAATTTNLAWSPGVIFIGSADYARHWASVTPTALAVTPAHGVSAASVRAAVAGALGPGSGLEVSTSSTRERRIDELTSEGLGRLGEISTLLLIAAILAMGAALSSSVWQRRPSLAGLRLAGVRPARLRQILLVEAAILLAAGCLTGAIAGIYGEVVIDGYLRQITGFPVAAVAASGRPAEILALVLAGALAIVAVPAWIASRVDPNLALEGD
jgi:putative ABC transport system permease protein